MAVIETFLKLMVEKRAERLVLAPQEVPWLMRGGERTDLSMPVLPTAMLERVAGELTGEGTPAVGGCDGTFRSTDDVTFSYALRPAEGGWRIEVSTGTVPADAPLPAAAEALATSVAAFTGQGKEVPDVTADWQEELAQAVSLEASDVFLSEEKPPWIRAEGKLFELKGRIPTEKDILALLPDEAARATFERRGSVDFPAVWEIGGLRRRFRGNVFRHMDGLAAVLRPVRTRIPGIEELGLPRDLTAWTKHASGLVLVTGASGSGKSTTLAAMIDHVNQTRASHVITLEDPVEYEHRGVRSLIHQRQVGRDVEDFSSGLRDALRENPDIILLGELRDLPTIAAALTAAETGHLVLATLHAGSASAAVSRIVDVFPGHQQPWVRVQLAQSLRAVLSQRLVPDATGGRLVVVEKLLVTPAVANGIREGQENHIRNAMLTGAESGMITLEQSLAALVRRGRLDRAVAEAHAADPEGLARLLG